MKKYAVIDLQKADFMNGTWAEPMTMNALRSRFWALDEARTEHYKYFTKDYIAEAWVVDFEVKE